MARYDVVIIGTPVWSGTVSASVRARVTGSTGASACGPSSARDARAAPTAFADTKKLVGKQPIARCPITGTLRADDERRVIDTFVEQIERRLARIDNLEISDLSLPSKGELSCTGKSWLRSTGAIRSACWTERRTSRSARTRGFTSSRAVRGGALVPTHLHAAGKQCEMQLLETQSSADPVARCLQRCAVKRTAAPDFGGPCRTASCRRS